jgi:hypothetical protein
MSQTVSAAPPRPRPRRWRRRILRTLLLLVLLGGGGIAFFLWYAASDLNDILAEIDRQDPGWRLADIEAKRKAVRDDKNSALQIMAVKALLGGQSVWTPAMDWKFGDLPPQVQFNDQQVAYLEKRFDVLKNAAVEARKLKDMPEGRYPIKYSDDFFSTILNCQEARGACEVLQWDAARRAHALDTDGALESCLALLHCARSFGDEPLIISMLVRCACNAIAVGALERTLAQAQSPPREASLKRLQAAAATEMQEPTFLTAVRGERAGAHHLLQNMREGKVTAKTLGLTLGDPVQAAMIEHFPGYRTRQHAGLLRYLHKIAEAAKLPPKESEERLKELGDTMKAEPALARLLAPAFTKVREAERRNQAYLRCAVAAVAAERFRLAKTRWPESLEALVKAGFLHAVPTDPYDHNPLRLKRLPDGLLVYSVGPDRVDNDGNVDRDRPVVPGTDQGFHLWDISHRRQPPNPPVEED